MGFFLYQHLSSWRQELIRFFLTSWNVCERGDSEKKREPLLLLWLYQVVWRFFIADADRAVTKEVSFFSRKARDIPWTVCRTYNEQLLEKQTSIPNWIVCFLTGSRIAFMRTEKRYQCWLSLWSTEYQRKRNFSLLVISWAICCWLLVFCSVRPLFSSHKWILISYYRICLQFFNTSLIGSTTFKLFGCQPYKIF